MDKRLELTEKQKELLNKVQNALNELDKANVRIVWDGEESYHVINAKEINEMFFPEDRGYDIEVDIEELPYFTFGCLQLCYTDNSFGVTFD